MAGIKQFAVGRKQSAEGSWQLAKRVLDSFIHPCCYGLINLEICYFAVEVLQIYCNFFGNTVVKGSMKHLSDIEIIDSVLQGNANDYSLLISRYKHKAFSLLKRMLKNEMDAEEVLQDCFVKSFFALKSFKREAKYSTWFYRIVFNSAVTKLSGKKRKIEQEMLSIDNEDNPLTLSVPEKEFSQGKNELLNLAIQELPENYSVVITLFYLESMSCEEISKIINTSVNNVKVLLHRSRAALKEVISQKHLERELL